MPNKSTTWDIKGKFYGKDILSIDQFTTKDIAKVYRIAKKMSRIAKKAKPSTVLKGNIVTLLFYEPSSRTFSSFDAAIKQLGGQTVTIQDPVRVSSVAKGETLADTVRVFEAYSDAIIIRHPQVGSLKAAADAAFFIPVINAGDGIGEHPTQALLDMYTIYEKWGKLNGLTGLMAGDMLNGRTVHSLLLGLSKYKKNTMYLLSPKELRLKKEDKEMYESRGIKIIEIESEKDIPKDANFWYWTRVQKERFSDLAVYEAVKNRYIVTPELLKSYAGKKTLIMHPLPRVGEILPEVDEDERAVYLRSEIRNGMYVRMALVALVLGKIK